ncbi:MAG: Xylose isomerase domain protein barrel [Caulobacteraceae bacterium]|nr:Xylose isomerase domain protein barrel [Caulobacteraceae bacterium]
MTTASARANPLSLHHLTALDVSPPELVTLAAALGCDHVCLFTQVQAETRALFPAVEDASMAEAVAERCAATGVSVHNLEYFPVAAETDPAVYRPALERGARLGAGRATAHIHDAERGRSLATFATLCALAAEYDLRIGLEFTAFSKVSTLEAALAFVRDAGADNGDVVLDALHFFRSGGEASALATMDLSRVGYVQICDGPARITEQQRMHEAVAEREVPGEGAFDLTAFVAALPPGPVVDVEVPQSARMAAGVSPLGRARLAVDGARRFL